MLMQNQKSEIEKAKEKKPTKKVVLRQLDNEGAKLLAALSEKANKKTFGRKIRDSEILTKALGLVQSNHLIEMQDGSYTGKDFLQMRYEEYQKVHGRLKYDDFLSKLARVELSAL